MSKSICWSLILLLLAVAVIFLACENGGDDDDGGGDDDDTVGEEFEVLSVQPASGPVEGGTPVNVYGRGFEQGAKVYFGGELGVDTAFVLASELNTTTPPAPDDQAGFVAVRVENPDGEYAELENGFRYGEPGVTVDWCLLKYPETTSTTPGTPTESIYGQVFVEGCTETQGSPCGSITGQVGHGPAGADPSLDPSLFTWTDAAYNAGFAPVEGTDEYNNDEFMAQITEDTEGVYKYAYRFSGDGGGAWTYCDLGAGTEDGFSPSMMGELTVEQRTIGWCILQYPADTGTQPDVASEDIFGRVYVEGCTDGDAYCGGLTAQVGHGPDGVDPSAQPGDFTWTVAAYNDVHVEDDNDEYKAPITESDEGDYRFAYRFSSDAGDSWIYCDLTGSDDGFTADQMGWLHVWGQNIPIDWCNIQWPEETTTNAGTPTESIYGRVYVDGFTGTGSASGQITAELGYGPFGTDPSGNPGAFTWLATAFNISVGNDDEYQATITPPDAGTFSYVYRFSTNAGGIWTYCDFGDGTANGFSVDDLGTLNVNTTFVSW